MIKGIVIGALGTIAAGLAAFYFIASSGLIPSNADANPPYLERWIAHKALDAAIARQAPQGPNPVALNDANLIAGIKLYSMECVVCHGAADGEPSDIARGLYQRAPQLAKFGVEDDDDGAIYWKVYHGIRMTGMPSFRYSLSDDDIWKITLFVKNMDSLPPGPEKVWDAVPRFARAGRPNAAEHAAE